MSIRSKKLTTLAKRIIASWPCLEGKALNPRGKQTSRKRKPAKCYLRRESA
ncbi:hypothetical protein M0R72_19995 [Candidatus Pacearchaeota archaeon]|jgi:hypothetical protein|nr:hypothetical protein [Candidatus Pacearchaeota archaeon]